MPTATCPQCEGTRSVQRIKDPNTLCRPCSNLNRNERQVKYYRTCKVCGDVKRVKTPTECEYCKDCYNANRTRLEDKHKETTCIDCGNSRMVRGHNHSVRCKSCAAKHRLLDTPMPKYVSKKPPEMRSRKEPKKVHYRTCTKCGDIKQVSCKAYSGEKVCIPCRSVPKTDKAKKPRQVKSANAISIKAIEKVRDANRAYKALLKRERKPIVNKMSHGTEQELIAQFYATNNVYHLDCKDTYGNTDCMMRLGD